MARLSISYTCKYRIKFAPNYWFTTCGICVNTLTSRKVKKVMKGGSIGYIIKSKFFTLENLRKNLEKIPNEKTPF